MVLILPVRAVLAGNWTAIMSMILPPMGMARRKLVGCQHQNLLRQSPIPFLPLLLE